MNTPRAMIRGNLHMLALALLLACTTGALAAERVDVYLFWAIGCPHCEREIAFLKRVEAVEPRVRVHYLEITRDAPNRRAVIQGRRGRAILTWDAGIEAVAEQLPLEDPMWKDVLRERKDAYLVTTLLPEKQPRLTLTQRGRSGKLVVRVTLELNT